LSELPISFIAAFLEAVITAIITVVLLKGQTDAEEVKERNVKVFEIKSSIFQDYIYKIWEIWEQIEISAEKYREMTKIFYKDIMLYLPKDSIVIMSEKLIELGNCMGKKQSEIYPVLRNITFSIINELVKNIGLGGKIDIDIHSRIEQKMYLLLFRQTILEEMNKALVYSNIEESPLSHGFYQEIEIGEFLFFPFKSQSLFGCYITIGPFTKSGDNKWIWLNMYVPSYRSEANPFRAKNIKYLDLEFGLKPVLLNEPLTDEIMNELGVHHSDSIIMPFSFDDYDSITQYKTNYVSMAGALALRAIVKFKLCRTKVGSFSIMEIINELQNINEEKKEKYAGLENERLKKEGI